VGLAGGVAAAAEGVQLVQRTTTSGTTLTSQVQIAQDKMRAEIVDPSSGLKQAIIFDAGRQVISIVNVERRTYVEVTKAQIDQLGAQMQGMMAQMEAAMANMPPAQRAQVEAMMRGRGMGMAQAPRIEYQRTGTDRVGQWACDTYEGTENGQKVTELCTVAPSALGLTAADAETMRQLAEFFKKLMPNGASMLDVGSAEQHGFTGVPIRTISSAGGSQVTTELTEVSRQTFEDSVFQVPAGFQKQEFMGSMGRGRN
jgi:hypothetical protein